MTRGKTGRTPVCRDPSPPPGPRAGSCGPGKMVAGRERLPLPGDDTSLRGVAGPCGRHDAGDIPVTGNLAVLLGLLALMFLGAWGWGRAARAVLRRRGWSNVDDVLTVPLQVLLGFALFLSAGGFLVALGIAKFGALLGWHVVGVAFLVPRLPAWARRARAADRRSTLRGAAVAVAGAALAFLALGQAIGIPLY